MNSPNLSATAQAMPQAVPPSQSAQPGAPATSQATVKTHGAESISDSTYWTAHGIALALVCIAVVWVFAAKGPRRKEALAELRAQEKTNTK
jgi:hypothetical protein